MLGLGGRRVMMMIGNDGNGFRGVSGVAPTEVRQSFTLLISRSPTPKHTPYLQVDDCHNPCARVLNYVPSSARA